MARTNNQNNWKNYITRVNNRFAKCNICNETCARHRSLLHLHKSHNITHKKVILHWNNDNHLIWQHFSKKDLFCAKCKYCGVLLKSAYSKSNLDVHLRLQHKKEIAAIREKITRTWVSSHFTFDLHNCRAKCTHCVYSAKIYDGVGVLKNHLKDDHNLEYSEHFMEEMLDHSKTTMQCATEESNVATSFQDGNTQ